MIVAAVIAALPTIVAKTPLRNTLLAYARAEGCGPRHRCRCVAGLVQSAVAIGDRGPRRGRRAAGDRRVDSHEPFAAGRWRAICNDLGEIEIQRPVFYLAVRPDGTNLARCAAAARWKTQAASTPGENCGHESQRRRRLRCAWSTARCSSRKRRPASGGGCTGVNAQFDSRGVAEGLPPISVSGQLDTGRSRQRMPATIARPPSFALALDERTRPATADLATAEHSARGGGAVAAACSARCGDQRRVVRPGYRDVVGDRGQSAQRLRRPPARSRCNRSTSTAPALAGDHVRLASVELPWRLTSQPTGVTIEDLQLKSDVGRFRGPRHARSGDVRCSRRRSMPLSTAPTRRRVPGRGRPRAVGGDVAAPAADSRRHDDHVRASCSWPAAANRSTAGSRSPECCARPGLAATSAGRPLAWDQPVDATFELRREQGELRLESLKCESEFLEHRRGRHAPTTHGQCQVRSQSARRTARAVCRFERAPSWPAPARPTSIGSKRDGDQFTARGQQRALAAPRRRLATARHATEPRLAIKAEATGTLDPATHEPLRSRRGPRANRRRRRSARCPIDRAGRLHGGRRRPGRFRCG